MSWDRTPVSELDGYAPPEESEDRRLCEEYLANPPSAIPQNEIWHLLRAFGRRLGYMVKLG